MGVHTMRPKRPVVDFDPVVCNYEDWYSKFAKLRKETPVFWSEYRGGYWVVSTYDDVTRIARDWETFSSAKHYDPATGEAVGGMVIPPMQAPPFIPVETDPPDWKKYRDLLNPHFGPKAIEAQRAKAEQLTDALLDRVIESGRFDIVQDLSNPMPALVTLELLGMPYDRTTYTRWAEPFHRLAYLRQGSSKFEQMLADLDWIRVQFEEQIDVCRRTPKDALYSKLCNARIAGELLSHRELVDLGMMILVGGVGTTTALTANSMYYLSHHKDDRQRLIDTPDLLPIAREEFVRFYTPVHSESRRVMKEVEVNGQTMLPGEQVLVPFSSANHDETAFERADEIVIDRFPNKHLGFGNGIHRCLGSFLARMFFDTMFRGIMARMPDYEVIEEEAARYPSIASTNGWIKIPAKFTPGKKVGTGIDLG